MNPIVVIKKTFLKNVITVYAHNDIYCLIGIKEKMNEKEIFSKDRRQTEKFNKWFDCTDCKYHKHDFDSMSMITDTTEHICELSNKKFERSTMLSRDESEFIEDFCELKSKDEIYFNKIGICRTKKELFDMGKGILGWDTV